MLLLSTLHVMNNVGVVNSLKIVYFTWMHFEWSLMEEEMEQLIRNNMLDTVLWKDNVLKIYII